jgi:hypothetical protein
VINTALTGASLVALPLTELGRAEFAYLHGLEAKNGISFAPKSAITKYQRTHDGLDLI